MNFQPLTPFDGSYPANWPQELRFPTALEPRLRMTPHHTLENAVEIGGTLSESSVAALLQVFKSQLAGLELTDESEWADADSHSGSGVHYRFRADWPGPCKQCQIDIMPAREGLVTVGRGSPDEKGLVAFTVAYGAW